MDTATVLGLDLGTNSIGWALIEHAVDKDGQPDRPLRLIDAGVRIFQQGVEANRNESRNVQRRQARGMRRQHRRRGERMDLLRERLQRAGLLPSDSGALAALMRENPYAFRARGLDERLSPYEFGRALYHLAQRRGFKSNRKSERGAERKKENEGIRAEITQIGKDIADSGARTLGEYLSRLDAREQRVRGRHTSREMYETEFDALWHAQRANHPELLTDSLRDELRGITFYQRPLKVQKHLVGRCELEPDKKRAPKGTWYAQQFRLLQDVNHLEVLDAATGTMRKLNSDERAKLVPALASRKEMTFDQIRKLLGLLDSQKFNFESGERREKIKGNTTEWNLRAVFKSAYDRLAPETRDEIVRDLLFVEDESVIRRHAVERWGLNEEGATALAKRDLQPGYLHLCEKALKKLLPEMEKKGLSYMEAIVAAGYQRPDQREVSIRDELGLEDMPYLRNPIVMAALHQTRHVVNAVVRAYGKPARIRVEMARDLKVSLDKRAEIISEQRKNERENDTIRKCLEEEFGIADPSRDDVVRYRLWKECAQTCPYTGRVISKEALFGAELQIEHIWPLDRSGDDSYMNKTLCWAEENRRKHNRTPLEAYGSDEQRWGEITMRIRSLPPGKRYRFLHPIPEEFITRQLNDTRYIAREARAYLETLAGKYNVQVGRGGVTAALRRMWGLNNLLSASGEKTRDDHRHHAVDAVVIALTTPAVVKLMSEFSARGYRADDAGFAPPWQGFRDEVKRQIEKIIVSHRVLREIRGALHEETNYGILGRRDEKGQELFAVRKPLGGLSANEVALIADLAVRQIVIDHLRRHGADPKSDKSAEWKKAMSADDPPLLPNRNGNPVPIKRVRLHKPLSNVFRLKNPQGVEYRAVDSGSNHHVVIFEYTDGKKAGRWDGEFVTMFEAARRAKAREPITRREVGNGRKFVMSLSANEMVKITQDGVADYWRVQKIDGANRRVTLRPHTDARKSDDRSLETTLRLNPLRELKPVKLTIDPLGREHPAND
jgi:CRISPR-associated endonuclease Csn1